MSDIMQRKKALLRVLERLSRAHQHDKGVHMTFFEVRVLMEGPLGIPIDYIESERDEIIAGQV